MDSIEREYFEKIKCDLSKVVDKNKIFRVTLSKLEKISSILKIREVLVNCYRELLKLEKLGKLTVGETVLLNDIDAWEDYQITSK
ncbi:hypothetical protein [Lactobacillus intestinalis]|uniref:hypothetical protein n=1 Tax=Lactobacillus intestinalis TaxID=151781 RepID=UPI001F5798CB|nr:hypothetical protein [Lactobacillus intestinalis]